MNSTTTSRNAAAAQPIEPGKVLADCCQEKTPCRFQFVHSGDSVRAIFQDCRPQAVELLLDEDSPCEALRPQSMVCISFPYRATFCGFLSCVLDVIPRSSGETLVTFPIPQQMVTSNLRQSFRIPIAPEVKMTARLHTENEESYRVIPRDLAQAGMEVEFPGETNPFLPVGSRVSIELQYRDETVLRTAEIRRALDSRYGLLFTDQTSEADQSQAARLNGIVLSLQQFWLKSRLK